MQKIMNLKKLREKSKLSQADFAAILQTDKNYWGQLERKENISLKHFLVLLDYADSIGIPLKDGSRLKSEQLIPFLRMSKPIDEKYFIDFENIKKMGVRGKAIKEGIKMLKKYRDKE